MLKSGMMYMDASIKMLYKKYPSSNDPGPNSLTISEQQKKKRNLLPQLFIMAFFFALRKPEYIEIIFEIVLF
jgi:hypothetical protein